jgi:acyl transferase domain-containing protein
VHGDHRLAVIGESIEQVRTALREGNFLKGKVQSKRRPKVGFRCTDAATLERWKQWGIQPDTEGEPALWVEATCDWKDTLGNLAQLYVNGVQVDWAGFDRGYNRRPLVLPTYPFQRQRHWVD